MFNQRMAEVAASAGGHVAIATCLQVPFLSRETAGNACSL